MGATRAWAPHTRWTEDELSVVREHYSTTPWVDLEKMLPGRARRMIQCKANELGLARLRQPKRTVEQVREAKRNHMARRWAEKTDLMREQSRRRYHEKRDEICAERREHHITRLFWTRALKLPGIKAKQLAALWRQQRGLCGLTGARLDRSAQIDHILPQARGGAHDIRNLRWVTAEANRAKRDLTDAEFLILCDSVVRWIGQRIEEVEAINSERLAA